MLQKIIFKHNIWHRSYHFVIKLKDILFSVCVGTSVQHNRYIVLHLSLCFNQKTVSESATSVKRGKGHNKPSRVVHKKEVVKLEKV